MSPKSTSPSVALVYDRVNTPYGGAENVLLALHQAFPQAPLFTSLYARQQAPWAQQFPKIFTSFLNKLAWLRQHHRWLAALMPLAFETLDLSEYDIIISVTSAEAKGILTRPDQLHLCYLLTPPYYLYHQQQHALQHHQLTKWPVFGQLAKWLLQYLRWWDQAAIFRPDRVIPISHRVAKRVRRFYPGVSPTQPLYPPVTIPLQLTRKSQPSPFPQLEGREYFLVVSRLVSYKKIELAIKACIKLKKQLVVVGTGPEKKRLIKIATSSQKILFLDSVTSEKLQWLYYHCRAVLMPGEEDFGIVALEANSFGKPVIINSKSGAAELIKPNIDGIHLQKETSTQLINAILELEKTDFSPNKITQNPVKYDTKKFVQAFKKLVNNEWLAKQKETA